MTDFQSESTADRIVAGFDRINEKVDAMRAERINDPDSLGDKLLKAALPSVAGFIAGKLFTLAWNHGVARRRGLRPTSDGTLGDGVVDDKESLLASLMFSALSASIGAVVSQLSDRGSQAIVNRRHRKHNTR
ncbi:hypothetical protein DSM100688_1015 [Bifidobacterium ramosum]|uniref:DUF4235 domain-containing protein n=1 Tax=Bifidobacterium ramosum TaxID=1798158 RepID=A0A6L4X1F2_9BIFI|nr:DUF4235 domain-containing protein [Bifidobacterium ramosum]KAB8288448.1 hypothetical protein DSM100688_1015 [Bifidobacterium ramosum]NEG71519.1 DUF4235 domain-containing protein [Bifidobacterium ramosum]